MDYKKKYKEALERAKRLHSEPTGGTERIVCEQIFPELRESEDERIRKELIGFLRNIPNSNYTCEEMARWLEKQGTQPRFNIGDVICDKSCTTLNKEAQPNMEIVDILNGMYICDKGSFPVSQQDEYVLVSKKIDTKLNVDSISNELREASFAHAEKEVLNPTFPNDEEFELIYTFEEGAKWDAAQKPIEWSEKHIADVFEKVGLAKIVREQSNDALTIALQDAMIELSKVTLQPNPTAWSEEDEYCINQLIVFCENCMVQDSNAKKCANWLKSIKGRVGCDANCIITKWSEEDELYIRELENLVKQVWATAERENDKDKIHKMSNLSFFLKTLKPQLKQEWSKDDEAIWAEISDLLWEGYKQSSSKFSWDDIRNWVKSKLKSLRPQNTWRPSDEQMKTLLSEVKGWTKGCPKQIVLESLYQDLKKLK